ncbi:MAG: HWE histidine kinase domain-containing protein [Pseudomonadales bacterium]
MIAELNHRVKNIIALVRSIARISQHSATSLEQFVSSYEKRLTALADAHSLVSANPLQWVSLREMLQIELRPYSHQELPLTLEGPEVAFRADVAPSLALILHELVSNAVKYGGLSSHGLGLEVSWQHSGTELNLRWQERSSQTPTRSRREGFGLVLLERAVPLEFQGTATINFANTGFCIDIWIPAQTVQLRSATSPSNTHASTELTNTASARPAAVADVSDPNHILIVEDISLLALELETHLRELGYSQTSVCANLTDARSIINSALPRLALLDINLAVDTTLELALDLIRDGVAVIFMSGSEPPRDLQKSLRQVPWLIKPIDRGLLERALTELLS